MWKKGRWSPCGTSVLSTDTTCLALVGIITSCWAVVACLASAANHLGYKLPPELISFEPDGYRSHHHHPIIQHKIRNTRSRVESFRHLGLIRIISRLFPTSIHVNLEISTLIHGLGLRDPWLRQNYDVNTVKTPRSLRTFGFGRYSSRSRRALTTPQTWFVELDFFTGLGLVFRGCILYHFPFFFWNGQLTTLTTSDKLILGTNHNRYSAS